MATFDVLEALDRIPVASETAASVVSGYRRWTTVNGPLKIEYNFYQVADGDNLEAVDTFVSSLAHPLAVNVEAVNHDLTTTAFIGSATLEGDESVTTFRTVTVRDAETDNAAGIIVTVYGY